MLSQTSVKFAHTEVLYGQFMVAEADGIRTMSLYIFLLNVLLSVYDIDSPRQFAI